MAASNSRKIRTSQQGQALLLMLLVLGIAGIALIYKLATPASVTAEVDRKTEVALAQARDSLLGYAASDSTRPGQLPCPDTTNDGLADSCSTVLENRVGRLPWKSLKIPDLRDGYGEQLWYAVSRNFVLTSVINSDTAAEYAVTGSVPASNVVAIVFASGPVIGTQVRDAMVTTCSTTGTSIARNRCAANYLEGGNEDGNTSFTTGLPTDIYNDKVLVITHDMLFKRVLQRVANHARNVLRTYYTTNNSFPTASAYADGTGLCTSGVFQGRMPLAPTALTTPGLCTDATTWSGANLEPWFSSNNWNRYVFYAVDPVCTDAVNAAACSASGALSVSGISTNVRALLIATGRAYTGQTRPCAAASDCLEDAENINGDALFTMPAASSTNNDQLFIVSP